MPVYRIIVENGNVIPSKQAFLNVSAHFNRFVVKTSSLYNLSHSTLQILSCLYVIIQARGNNKPFALTTLSRNYFVSSKRYKLFIARCFELHRNGLITLQYEGKVKGAKVAITHLGIKALDELYEDFKMCMLDFPIQG
jgi:hypothetical protein